MIESLRTDKLKILFEYYCSENYYIIFAMIRKPKYQQVFDTIKEAILAGSYEPGQKLPSEAQLLEEFDTSRITVIRALRELQQRGLRCSVGRDRGPT